MQTRQLVAVKVFNAQEAYQSGRIVDCRSAHEARVRALGAFYMRLVGKPVDIFQYLEPLYNDYRKVRHRTNDGWELVRMDQFIDKLLTDETRLAVESLSVETQEELLAWAIPRLDSRALRLLRP